MQARAQVGGNRAAVSVLLERLRFAAVDSKYGFWGLLFFKVVSEKKRVAGEFKLNRIAVRISFPKLLIGRTLPPRVRRRFQVLVSGKLAALVQIRNEWTGNFCCRVRRILSGQE